MGLEKVAESKGSKLQRYEYGKLKKTMKEQSERLTWTEEREAHSWIRVRLLTLA